MKRSGFALFLAITMLAATPASNADWSTGWTLSELHQALLDAENSDDLLKSLLAKKVYEEMQNQGVRFVENDLLYIGSTTGWRSGLGEYNSDVTRDAVFDVVKVLSPIRSVGSCSVPLPGFSLLAVDGSAIGFSGRLYGNKTALFLRASQGRVEIGVQAVGEVAADAAMGVVWGGTYPVPATEYRCDIPVPPYPCGSLLHPKMCTTVCGYVPTVEMRCEEWRDGGGLKAQAKISGSLVATLDTSYSVSDRQIVLKKNLALSGQINSIVGSNSDFSGIKVSGRLIPYVTPDISEITGPSPSSAVSAQILAEIVGLPIAVGSAALGALGPLLPPDAIPVITAQAGTLVGLSLVGFEQEWVRSAYQNFLAQQNASFDARGYNDPIVVQLPADVNDQLLKDVLRLLSRMGITDFLVDFVRANLNEILYYILTDDREGLNNLFASEAACRAISAFAISMPNVPLYATNIGGTCEVADVYGADRGHYYTDSLCTKEVAFRPTPPQSYCDVAMAGQPNATLGNADSWTPDSYQVNDVAPNISSRKWTQWLGTRLPVPAESIAKNFSPYMKQVHYRDVTNAGQTKSCALEMRIFKKDITAQNRPALLALHGGSWTYRGAAYMALETTISHYTERGFVVFVPFYRLVGQNDGSPECNMAQWQEVVADAEAALDWVKSYGTLYGVGRGKVAVTGQSAGAHLSEWLVTHRPQDVSAALLHYAPADTHDFISNAHAGGNYEAWMPSLSILSDFFGTDVTQLDMSNPPDFVIQNSFARLVQDSPQPMPPAFMLHGIADALVPSNQAVVLCNAYGGTAKNDGGGTAMRAIYGCGGSGGQLHMFEQGEHGLDACVNGEFCLSGSTESASLVAESEHTGRDWLYERTSLPMVLPVASISASKGSASGASVIDGNTGSAWVAKSGQYLQLDLGISRPVGALGAVWGGGQTRSSPSFTVESSLDQVHWSEVFRGQASGLARGVEVFDFADKEARYVRFVAQSGDQLVPLRVAELRLYGPVTPVRLTAAPVQSLATGLQRIWNSMTGSTSWNQYDLGGASEIAHVMLAVPQGENMEIQFSLDGTEWKIPSAVQGSGSERLLDFREVIARYIRVSAPRNTSVAGDVEFSVYGASTDTGAVATATATATASGSNGGGSMDWTLLLLVALPFYRRAAALRS